MGWIVATLLILTLTGGAVGLYMILVEPRWFHTWRVELPVREDRSKGEVALRSGRFPPLRILHVTDTHFGHADAPKLQFLERVVQESFDFVFLTGDLIETSEGVGPCEEFVRNLSPRRGTYAVLGGHDYYHSDDLVNKYTTLAESSPQPFQNADPNPTRELREMLDRCGVDVLSDENRQLDCGDGQMVSLIGLRDAYLFDCDYETAWDGVPAEAAQIVLAHSPDVLDEVCRRGVDLAFFGHTHGGQVRFPVIGAVVTRSHLPGKHARGLFRRNGTIYTLNRGVGAGKGSNFRLLCRPEVTVLQVAE